VTDEDAKLNKIAVLTGRGSVLGNYRTSKEVVLWVMTTLTESGSRTIVLLPHEY
jgi:hypothetical protein